MAVATPGPLVASISGTVGSCVFRATGGGCVVSRSPTKSVSASVASAQARSVMARVVKRWGELTGDEQREWNAFGQRVQMSSRSGPSRHPSGRALWLKHMTRWMTMGFYVPVMVPGSFPVYTPPVESFTAEAGVGTWVTFEDVVEGPYALWYLARSSSLVGWSRVCWHYLGYHYFSVPWSDPFDLRSLQLPVLGEFQVGEKVRLRIQWLYRWYAITAEPLEYECTVT